MPARPARFLRTVASRVSGASMMEFALLAGLVAIAALGAVVRFSEELSGAFERTGAALSGPGAPTAGAGSVGGAGGDTPEPPPEGAMVLRYAGTEAAFAVTGADLAVDWGDGATDTAAGAATLAHTYAGPGPHRVAVTGTADSFANTAFDALVAVESFGALGLSSLEAAFEAAAGLDSLAPLPGTVTDISGLLRYAGADPAGLAAWDVSGVVDAAEAFRGTDALSADLSGWATGSIADFSGMFQDAQALSPAISGWDLAAATTTARMFKNAAAFDADLSGWAMGGVADASEMFRNAAAFTSDLSGWDVASVAAMESMFAGAAAFESDLADWCVEKIATRPAGFAPAGQLATEPIWGYCGAPDAGGGTLASTYSGGEARIRLTEATGVISWGDGTVERVDTVGASGQDQILTHAYADATAEYEVFYDGAATRFANESPATLVAMASFGDLGLTSIAHAFENTTADFASVPAGLPATVTTTEAAFRQSAANPDGIGSWEMSGVVDASNMFEEAGNFNRDIGGWDVAGIADFSKMFKSAAAFNKDIGGWTTSSAEQMYTMFDSATSFNQDIGGWDMTGVLSTRRMFAYASAFNQDLGAWEMGSVELVNRMFEEADSLDAATANIGGWDLSSVDTGAISYAANFVFLGADSFAGDLAGWCVPGIAARPNGFAPAGQLAAEPFWGYCGTPDAGGGTLEATYKGPEARIRLTEASGVIGWGDGAVEAVDTVGASGQDQILTHPYADPGAEHRVFYDGTAARFANESPATLIRMTSFGEVGLTSLNRAFRDTTALEAVPDSVPATVTDYTGAFMGTAANPAGVAGWATAGAEDMTAMFRDATNFNRDVSGFDLSGVEHIDRMFSSATAFDQDLDAWDVSNVAYFQQVFANAASFNGDVGGWDLSSAYRMNEMFRNAASFNQDLSGWDMSHAQIVNRMFQNANALDAATADIGDWDLSGVDTIDGKDWHANYMFADTDSFDGDLSDWCVPNIGSRPYEFAAPGSLAAEPFWGFCDVPGAEGAPLKATYRGSEAGLRLKNATGVIKWGDGTIERIDTTDGDNILTHAYPDSRTEYRVRFDGAATAFGNRSPDSLRRMSSFGDLGLAGLYKAFSGTTNLAEVPASLPASVRQIDRLFEDSTANPTGMENWDTSNVTLAAAVFQRTTNFNRDIGDWDFSGIPDETYGSGADNLESMFNNAGAFDQDISGWCVPTIADRPASFAPTGQLAAEPSWGNCP